MIRDEETCSLTQMIFVVTIVNVRDLLSRQRRIAALGLRLYNFFARSIRRVRIEGRRHVDVRTQDADFVVDVTLLSEYQNRF